MGTMTNKTSINSPLRVTILSDSVVQRASLKTLLSEQGSKIVDENSLGGYDPDALHDPTDVLLIDLKNAADLSLDKLEDLMDNSRIPVLFNDGATIPATEGPVRDDWAHNLTNKLYKLANKELDNPALKKKKRRPSHHVSANKFQNTKTPALKKDFPRVAIISKSKTRRNVLKNLLNQQGLINIKTQSFKDIDLNNLKNSVDILLVDKHNIIDKYDISSLNNITRQKSVGHLVCNSSKIPLDSKKREALGNKLLKKLTSIATKLSVNETTSAPIARFESNNFLDNKPESDATAQSSVNASEEQSNNTPKAPFFKMDPAHWADRLSDALAGVRKNLRAMERKQVVQKDSASAVAEKDASLTSQNTEQKVVQLPVKPRRNKTKPETDKIVENSTESQSNPGILDIYSDMLKAVKEVPSESEVTILFSEHKAPVNLDISEPQETDETSSPTQTVEKTVSAGTSLKQDKPSSGFEFSENFVLDTNLHDDNELAFELELRSLKDELDIFESNKEEFSLFEDSPAPEKKKKLLGINWSNPFK